MHKEYPLQYFFLIGSHKIRKSLIILPHFESTIIHLPRLISMMYSMKFQKLYGIDRLHPILGNKCVRTKVSWSKEC